MPVDSPALDGIGRTGRPQALDDPFYYLNNFQQVLDWISGRYGDLLNEAERDFIDGFTTLPRASQALLARMVMRKGELFRASKLRYAEIGCPREAVQPLMENRWVDAAPALTLDQLFEVSTKAEIAAAFKAELSRPGARKGELLEMLRPVYAQARCFECWCPGVSDAVYSLSVMAMCDRFRLMFFGNLRQSWTEFVLADLGLYRYESVAFTEASRAFQQRGDVDEYLHLYHCRERFEHYCATAAINHEAAADGFEQLLASVPSGPGLNPWIENRRAKLFYQMAYWCERRVELATALALYSKCSYSGARVRRIRVLERTGDFQQALTVAENARSAPESEAERQQLLRILPRLQRKVGLPKPAAPKAPPLERFDLTLTRPQGRYSVEDEVRTHLSEPEAPVWYVENTLINSLFGLLCWDAIFAPIPGAFFHPFQSGPVDLLSQDFYSRRAGLIDARLAQLDDGDYRQSMLRTWEAKRGLQSPFVYWEGLNRVLLEQALDCLPPAHLKAWFGRLLVDIKANRAGLPDLIQFWPKQKRYLMIEVKAPGDRLQDNQLRWLDFCARQGMPARVCYVQWSQGVDPDGLDTVRDEPGLTR